MPTRFINYDEQETLQGYGVPTGTPPSGIKKYINLITGDVYVNTGGVWTGPGLGPNALSVLPAGSNANAVTPPRLPFLNVKDFGAKGDAATDDTVAIQAALNALNQTGFNRGGCVFFPPGEYLYSSTLTIPQAGVTLRGPSKAGQVVGGYGCSATLTYTAAGGGTGINARATSGASFRDLGLRYTNAAYNGTLCDFSLLVSGTAGAVIEGCTFGGTAGATSCATLIDIDGSYWTTIRNSTFEYAQIGIRGNFVQQATNVVFIEDCNFDHNAVADIANASQNWEISNCIFEPGLDGAIKGYKCLSAGESEFGPVRFSNCWFGDTNLGTCIKYAGSGLTVDSCGFLGGAIGLDLGINGGPIMNGVTLIGGYWIAGINVRTDPASGATVQGLVQMGGYWGSATAVQNNGNLIQNPFYMGGAGQTPSSFASGANPSSPSRVPFPFVVNNQMMIGEFTGIGGVGTQVAHQIGNGEAIGGEPYGSLLYAPANNNFGDIGHEFFAGNTWARILSIRNGAAIRAFRCILPAYTTVNQAGGAVVIDARAGEVADVVCTASGVTSSISNALAAGQRLTLSFVQDATGGRTYTWPPNCKFAANAAPAASITANTRDTVNFVYDGTNWCETSRAVGVPT